MYGHTHNYRDLGKADPYNPFEGHPRQLQPGHKAAVMRDRGGHVDMVAYSPILHADLVEGENDFHVTVDLPGAEDIVTEIVGKNLIIKAERKPVHNATEDKIHSTERSYGSLCRTIPIPENADTKKVKCSFKRGVLTVTFPKLKKDTMVKKKLKIDYE